MAVVTLQAAPAGNGTLDNAFSSDEEEESDGEDITTVSMSNKSNRYTLASTSRRHLLLGAMLAEVEKASPAISLTPQQVWPGQGECYV